MKTMSLEQFKTWYWKNFPNSTYRLGQAFLNGFVKDTTEYQELWNEKDPEKANEMIWKIILDCNWDVGSLQVIRPGNLKV